MEGSLVERMSIDILHLNRMPWPTSWDDLFGRGAPLLVEIGFGGGHFLVDLAQQHPECNILGVEISLPSLRRGLKKASTRKLKNIRIIQGDSRQLLWLLTEPGKIREVYINFPDPWPKIAHHQRRLINEEFLHLLATRMETGGSLQIATDHAEYAAVITTSLNNSPYFESIFEDPFQLEDRGRLRTKYELKAIDEGRPCHYYKWVRNPRPAVNLFPYQEEYSLPHVVVETALHLEEIYQRFKPFHPPSEKIPISFIDIYRSGRDQNLLVEIFVNEDPFPQRVGLVIRRRSRGDFVISLHELGFPRPTKGIHLAVYYLVNWLQSLSKGTIIVNSTLNLQEMTFADLKVDDEFA